MFKKRKDPYLVKFIEDWDDERIRFHLESDDFDARDMDSRRTSLKLHFKRLLGEFDSDDDSYQGSSVTDYSVESFELLANEQPPGLIKASFEHLKTKIKRFGEAAKLRVEKNSFLFFLVTVSIVVEFSFAVKYSHLATSKNNIFMMFYVLINVVVVFKAITAMINPRVLGKIREWNCVVEMTLITIVISYTIRIFTETLLRKSALFLVRSWHAIYMVNILAIFITGFLFSLNPEHVSFISITQELGLLIVIYDRILTNPLIMKFAESAFITFVVKPLSLMDNDSVFFISDRMKTCSIFRYIHLLIAFGFATCATNFLGMNSMFGYQRSESALQVASGMIVHVIQAISCIFSPILALLLSTSAITQMSYPQTVTIMTTFLVAPSLSFYPRIFNIFPKRELILYSLGSLMAVKFMCGVMAPTCSLQTAQLISSNDESEIKLLHTPFKGIRCGLFFIRKAITYIVSFALVTSFAMPALNILLSSIFFRLTRCSIQHFILNVVTASLYPFMKMIGIHWDDLNTASTAFAEKILTSGAEMGGFEVFTEGINERLLLDCFMAAGRGGNITVNMLPESIFYALENWNGTVRATQTIKAPLSAHAIFVLMFLLFNCFSIKFVALFYATYMALLRSSTQKIFNAIIRGTSIAFATSLLAGTVASLYFPAESKFHCVKEGILTNEVCGLMISLQQSSKRQKGLTLCEEIKGELLFEDQV